MHTSKEYSESSLGIGLGLRLHDLSPRRSSSSMHNDIYGGLAFPPSFCMKQSLSRPRDAPLNSGTRSLSVGRSSIYGAAASSVQNRYSGPLPQMKEYCDAKLKDYGNSNVQRYGGPMFSRPKDGSDSTDMMEYANVNAVLSRLSILPMEMKGFLHGTSLKEKLKTIRKTLDDNKASCTSELDAWKEKWKRDSIRRRLHPQQKNSRSYNSSDPTACSLRQEGTANMPSSTGWRVHQERSPKQCPDQTRLQSQDRSRDPSRLQVQDHGRVQIQLQSRDPIHWQSRDATQLQCQDRIHFQGRDHIRLEIRDQIRLEIRDCDGRQSRDQTRLQTRDQPRDQIRLQTRVQTRLQNQDQCHSPIQDRRQQQSRDQTRAQSRLQSLDQTCAQIRLQSRDEAGDQALDQNGEQFEELTREQPAEQLLEEACDEIRDQPTNGQKVERLPYSDQNRDQTHNKTGDKFRYQIGDFEDKIESLPYSSSDQNKDQPRDHTEDQIDYGQNIECLPYSDSDESRDQPGDQTQEQSSYEQLIECLLYSDSCQSSLPNREQTHDETVELLQEQAQDQALGQSGEQSGFGQKIECLHYSDSEWSRNKINDQSSSEQKIECLQYTDSGQSRDRIRNLCQEKIRDQTRTQPGRGKKIDCVPHSGQSRRQCAEQLRDQAQEQTRTAQKIECLSYSDQSRKKKEERFGDQSGEQFQEKTSFRHLFEHVDYSDSDHSNVKNHLYLQRIIDGSRKEFALRTFEKFVHSRLTHYMLMYITACAKGLTGDEKTKFLSLFKVEGAFKHKPLNEGTYCDLLSFVDIESSPSKDVIKALDVAETSLLEEAISRGYDLKAIGDIRMQMRAFVSLGRPMSSFLPGLRMGESYHDECLFTVELLQDLVRAANQAKLGGLQGLHKLIKLACFLALKGMDSSSSSD